MLIDKVLRKELSKKYEGFRIRWGTKIENDAYQTDLEKNNNTISKKQKIKSKQASEKFRRKSQILD